jgi:putative membrane protein
MNRMHTQRLVSIAASLLLTAAPIAVIAQAGASDDDKHFVEAALKGGMAEVELGKLAADKGASEDVKMFGRKMVEDHTKMGDQMKTVAAKVGVTPPSMSGAEAMAEKAKLEMLSGKSFDDAYIKAMVKDHEEDLADFKKEAETGTSPSVKNAARQGETVVSHHLAMIRKIAQDHNVTASYRKPSAATLASATGTR